MLLASSTGLDEQVRVKSPRDTPRAPRHPKGARALALVASLVFAFALTLGAAEAQARTSQQAHESALHGKRSIYGARRVLTRFRSHRHKQSAPAPEPSPTPVTEPSPTPEPTPNPQPSPTPAPEPTPAPAPAPTPAPAPSGSALFNGNFDAGFKGWYVQSLSSRATLFSSGAFEGNQAARFEVRQGDVEPDTGSQRSEVSGPTFKEGEDLYIRDAFRVPASNTYSVPWQIIQQLHEEDWNGSPGMAVRLEDNRVLELGAGDGSPTFWRGPSLQTDRWYDLVYRVNLSQSSSAGFVEVWLDGVQQKLANGQTRIYGQTIADGRNLPQGRHLPLEDQHRHQRRRTRRDRGRHQLRRRDGGLSGGEPAARLRVVTWDGDSRKLRPGCTVVSVRAIPNRAGTLRTDLT